MTGFILLKDFTFFPNASGMMWTGGDRDYVVEWMNGSFSAGYQAAQNDNDSFGGTD